MNSSENNPLAFFEWYLLNGLNEDLNSFYTYFNEEQILEIDKKTYSIVVDYDLPPFTFENYVDRKLMNELANSINLLQIKFEKAYLNGTLYNVVMFYLKKINLLRKKDILIEFPFINKYIIKIEDEIKKWNNEPVSKTNYSFVLKGNSSDERIQKAKKLYSLLKENNFIECDKNDFINAFTGKRIENGIKWKIQSIRNRQTNKKSLIYFIHKLFNKHLSYEDNGYMNKSIEYVFRNIDGNKLKNIKQSKSALDVANFPEMEKLDDIISSLDKE